MPFTPVGLPPSGCRQRWYSTTAVRALTLVVLHTSSLFRPCPMPFAQIPPSHGSSSRWYCGVYRHLRIHLCFQNTHPQHRVECVPDIEADGCAELGLLYRRRSELFHPPSRIDRRTTSSKPILVGAQGALSPEVFPQPLRYDLLENFSDRMKHAERPKRSWIPDWFARFLQ